MPARFLIVISGILDIDEEIDGAVPDARELIADATTDQVADLVLELRLTGAKQIQSQVTMLGEPRLGLGILP